MKRPDQAVLRQTRNVALCVLVLVAVMLVVYAVIGKLTASVALGGLYSGLLGVLNFFIMGLTVQKVTERAAERERDEQELANFSTQMQNRMKISYNMRMIALFALLVLGIAVIRLDALATILPSVFPSIAVRVLQVIEARGGAKSKEVNGNA